jgi:hypothetical protein
LTRAAKTIITEDSGAPLRKSIAELKANKITPQRAVDNGVDDYNLLMMGNKASWMSTINSNTIVKIYRLRWRRLV